MYLNLISPEIAMVFSFIKNDTILSDKSWQLGTNDQKKTLTAY